MKTLLPVFLFSAVASGCVGARAPSDDIAPSYFNQQAYAEKTSLELWMDMRHESEVKEVFDVKWVPKLKQTEASVVSRTQKLAKMNLAKNKKSDKPEKKPEEKLDEKSDETSE